MFPVVKASEFGVNKELWRKQWGGGASNRTGATESSHRTQNAMSASADYRRPLPPEFFAFAMAPPSQGRGSSVGPQMTQKTLLGFMKKKDDGETRFSISSPAAPTTAAVIATSISTRAAESRASNSTPFKPFVPTMATVAQTPCAVKTWSSAGNQSSAPGRSSARRSAPSNIAEPIDVDMLDDDEVTVPKLVRH